VRVAAESEAVQAWEKQKQKGTPMLPELVLAQGRHTKG
jgi:hypothetical protein